MNILDRAIAVFSPEAALKRQKARLESEILASYDNYGASKSKKSMIGWRTKTQSPDEDIVGNVPLLRERSRDLFAGVPIATGAIKTIATNVVGAGLKPNVQIDYEFLGLTEEEADAWELQVEREFAIWANTPNCDAARINNFYELQYLAFMSVLMSGDAFAMLPMIPRANMPYDLRVSLLEADYVCDPKGKDPTKNILEGVEIGDYGEHLAYYVSKYHPKSKQGALKNEWKRIEAYGKKSGRRNILHLISMERPNQRRGVPLLAPVLETLKQLGRYTDAELTAAVISGMYSVFIKTNAPDSTLGESAIPYDQQVDAADEASYELGAGTIMSLAPNESIEIANPTRPNTAFDGFVIALSRQIGVALELPYELLIKHFTASYSASRAALLEAWKMFRMKRAWLSANFCQPIYEEFLTEAILKGRIQANGFFADPAIKAAWCGCEWVGPSQGQIDPVKEGQAAKLRVEENFSTREREAMELTGGDFSRIVKVRTKEERLRREGGLVVDNNGLPIAQAQQQAEANANAQNELTKELLAEIRAI